AELGIATRALVIGFARIVGHLVRCVRSLLRNRHRRAALLVLVFRAAALFVGVVAGKRRGALLLIGCRLPAFGRRFVLGLDLRLRLGDFVLEIDGIGGGAVLLAALAAAAGL